MPHRSYNRKPFTGHVLFVALLAMVGQLLAFASLALSDPLRETQQWRWSGVERVVVIPDIHGAYPAFTQLLQSSGIVDNSLNWIGGTAHLVSMGDMLDRGAESRRVMDLLMRLQEQALAQGGRVHVLAGNHETMNLVGDLRYVSAGEFSAFSGTESAQLRSQAYQQFIVQQSGAAALSFLSGGVNAAERGSSKQLEFDELYPQGYFGHRSAFAPEGRYGRWLLSLPAIIVINATAFVHGGLPAVTATAPLDELNRSYHTDLRRFFELWRLLIEAGVLTQDSILTNRRLARQALRIAEPSTCTREERQACARERGRATDQQRSPGPEVLAALKELLALQSSPMFGTTGPLWYRGSVRCKPILEMPVLRAALDNLGAERVVVGHTPTNDRRVHQIRDQRIIMLDTGMVAAPYDGRPAALIIAKGDIEVLYLNPHARSAPLEGGGTGAYPLNDTQLRQALHEGEILAQEKGWFANVWNVELQYLGVTLAARFFPANEQATSQRELAASRLDELLGFGLVAMTVEREINGQAGVLQLAYPDFLTESQRWRQRIEASGACDVPIQRQLLEVYDLLIANAARSSANMGYLNPGWNLQASGHGKAFGLLHTLPGSAGQAHFELPVTVLEALLELDAANLYAALAQQLDAGQITALLARRDAILAIMKHPAASYGHPEQAARGGRR